jgi:hypothetical protein
VNRGSLKTLIFVKHDAENMFKIIGS